MSRFVIIYYLNSSVFNKKLTRYAKKQYNMTKERLKEKIKPQMLDLADKIFKVSVINMFKRLKKPIFHKLSIAV